MYHLKLQHHFDSSHKLCLDYESPCQRLHGHRWEVVVQIWSKKLNDNGILVDFKDLKAVINELDHQYLNDLVEFNPTAENLSKYLYNKIKQLGNFEKVKIELFESPNASVTYYEN